MTAANHVLAGTIIGTLVHEPLLAVPAALLSHFVMDVVPHFGFKDWEDRARSKRLLNFILIFDGLLLFIVTIWLLAVNVSGLALVCGFVAASPDFVWVYRFIFQEKFGRQKPRPGTRLTRFHAGIQIFEFKYGLIIEYPTTVFLVWYLNSLVT